jgi:hypothetical protein
MYGRVKGCLTVVVADYAGFPARFSHAAASGLARLDLLSHRRIATEFEDLVGLTRPNYTQTVVKYLGIELLTTGSQLEQLRRPNTHK